MDINTFLDTLFERARPMGFEAYEAYYTAGDEFQLSVFNGEIIDYTSAGTLGLSFRALINKKMGYASTQALDDAAIGMLLDGAKSNAELIDSDDEQFIFGGSAAYPDINMYNPAIGAISAADKIDMTLELEKTATALDPRVSRVDQCVLVSMTGERRIINSKGVDLRFRDNAIGMYLAVTAYEEDKSSSGLKYVFTRSPDEINIAALAQGAVREALDGLTAKPVSTGAYRALLRNDAAAALLATFCGVFSADAAQKGLSLLRGRENSEIAAPSVTVFDDPHLPRGLASTPFDAEGVATSRRAVIERGVLTTLLHNLKTAKKQNVQTTGNASKGSYAAPVGVAPTNFYVKPSNDTFDNLLGKLGEGILITELTGLHSGAYPISGEFSLGAKGFIVKNGAITQPVNQITVAGNFFDTLKRVEAVGSDLCFGFPGPSYCGSPALLVSELSVGGI
jgi:PmbA protein